jgi:mono/diheme cytochrome c family protein
MSAKQAIMESNGSLMRNWAFLVAIPLLSSAAEKPVDFNRDIRPILSDNCFTCHGPDEKRRMAGVRLDTRDGAMAVVTPGQPDKSRVYVRVSHPDPKRRMPPPASGHKLTDEQIAKVKRWIEQGAEYRIHWAYEAPKRLDPPAALKSSKWVRNPIDQFVLARLEKEGLHPSQEADRPTLLRRLSFDLTGLPPTPAEVDAFVKDRAPNAYEKQVDRLLASPHYGERMAMQWLDLARYADTHGFHIDSHRDMWPWRDWVIRAFNTNMPFDRFTVEQIAGDLLPDATVDQRIASGFNRNHMINYEGGAIEEEYRTEYVADRVETTSNVWLAMTMGCARCHDHKYDPIPQKDFYRMFAFFNTVKEKGLDGKDGNAEPFLALPNEEQKRRLDDVKARIKVRESELTDSAVKPLIAEWEAKQQITWEPVASLRQGLVAHYEMDGGLTETSGGYRHGRLVRGEAGPVSAAVGQAMGFTMPSYVVFDGVRLGGGEFTIATWLQQGFHEPLTVFSQPGVVEVWYDSSDPLPHLRRGAHLHVEAAGRHVATRERLVQGDFYHVVLTVGAGGVKLWVNGEPEELVDIAPSGAEAPRELKLTPQQLKQGLQVGRAVDTDERAGFRGRLADLRVYGRALSDDEIRQLAWHQRMAAVLATPSDKRTKEQVRKVREYFLTYAAPQNLRDAWSDLQALRKQKAALDDEIPNTMVMAESDKPVDTFVLARGDYRNKTDKVTPNTPSALPPLPPGPVNRLALAKWLVEPQNPLTARVTVNRYWQNYFGIGLVKTSENFGSQGDPPSHPELLDWLATEFVRTGWDIKAMQRLIVTSATYRQSSKATPELIERDPENRLLAHMSRFRLPAEMVRDGALAESGLLNPAVGGRSVYPYQPPGIWEEIARGEIFSAQVYKQSHGDDLYRRSMYWFWKRTAPPTSLTTFDAPDREKCTARRSLTNTPLQALVLMNDPTFVEAARVIAEKTIEEAGSDTGRRVDWAFRRVMGRRPDARELEVLKALAGKQISRYAGDPAAAGKLAAVGERKPDPKVPVAELAAWTNVVTVMLNTDEAITKE